jgi:hypothetical protein
VLLGDVERVKETKTGTTLKIKITGPKAAKAPIESSSCVFLELENKSFVFLAISGEPKIGSSSIEFALDTGSVSETVLENLKQSSSKKSDAAAPVRVFRLRTTEEVRMGPLDIAV